MHRFLRESEREQWILDGIELPSHDLRFNAVTRIKVEYGHPMVQLAIKYEHWPIKVVPRLDETYGLISDASGEFTG